jgi:hypothetical protein
MHSHCYSSRSFLRRVVLAASVAALAAAPFAASAQSDTASTDQGHLYSSTSSSADWKAFLADDQPGTGLPGAPSPAPQYGQGRNTRYPDYNSRWSHLAFEAGAGPTAPVGNDVSGGSASGLAGYTTWGYNITAGAGWNFTKHIGALIEYQFNRNKIPGATLAVLGAPGGNVNTWSLTIEPIFYVPVTHKLGGYITGGGGFYRKVTNYTEPSSGCYFDPIYGYICDTQNVTIYHFSSNQGGMNLGAGLYWKAFGEDSNAKLYAEARYVFVDSPSSSAAQPFAEGTEELIPITFGVRF